MILRSDLIRLRDVKRCFRARVIAQMKEEKIRVKMVVVVLLWSRRRGGGGRILRSAARVLEWGR